MKWSPLAVAALLVLLWLLAGSLLVFARAIGALSLCVITQ